MAKDGNSSGDSSAGQRPSSVRVRHHIHIPGYHVLEKLGSGTSGTVYRAIQLSMQKEVAVRVILPELTKDEAFITRYTSEARSIGGVHHANVLGYLDVGRHKDVIYAVMELITGATLRDTLQDPQHRPSTVHQAVGLIGDCARALEALHRTGLHHGNIHPGNVFITTDGQVKLADGGLQAVKDYCLMHDQWLHIERLGLQAAEWFQVPNICDIRSDIFVMGSLLLRLMTGSARIDMPLDSPTNQRLAKYLSDRYAMKYQIPGHVISVIAKAMADTPEQRYQSPAHLREDIERIQFDFQPIHVNASFGNELATAFPLTEPVKESAKELAPEFTRASANEDDDEMASAKRPAVRPRPEQTVKRDAQVVVVPQASEHQSRTWKKWLLAASVGAVVVGGIMWWFTISTGLTAFTSKPNQEKTADKNNPALNAAQRPGWASDMTSDNYGLVATLTARQVAIRLRLIPAGTFTMGSLTTDPNHRSDESAVQVTLHNAFWMSESEVTQGFATAISGKNNSSFQGDQLPVENMSWNETQLFLEQLNSVVPGLRARLPTEAEWEYACRAGNSQTSSSAPVGWFSSATTQSPQKVMSLPANAFGLFDMHGNVMEWCYDLYGPYPTQPAHNPVGSRGMHRVARGGAWSVPADEGRATARAKYLPVTHHSFLGFRFVVDDESASK
jgi:formylglycine-generating enzyme required for sulfatase activity/serine/threonine protein kinase